MFRASGLCLGKKISIEQAPTRWGRVSFTLQAKPETGELSPRLNLLGAKAPAELTFKLRLPAENKLRSVTVNGRAAKLGGPHGDTVMIATGDERKFEILAERGDRPLKGQGRGRRLLSSACWADSRRSCSTLLRDWRAYSICSRNSLQAPAASR